MEITLKVNGGTYRAEAAPGTMLMDVLRELGFTGVKRGCGEGTCGSCAVLVDGRLALSCVVFAAAMEGRELTTIEGIGTIEAPHPIQDAFVNAGAVQCGRCTPGMVLATKALLDINPDPTEEDVKAALDGNLCRCTGYVKILDAVHAAAAALRQARREGGGP
jgi:carbon-monoxide dehydrogenase small subunit